jgi:hypothetical protein
MAIEQPEGDPPAELACPYCDATAAAAVLGSGETRRLLPYFDLAANVQELDRLPIFSEKMRPLVHGQIVCFSEEPDIIHFAKVEEVFTSRAHVSTSGMPSISFVIGGESSDPIPHYSGAETLPWWCWSDELPKASCSPVVSEVPVAVELPTNDKRGKGRPKGSPNKKGKKGAVDAL